MYWLRSATMLSVQYHYQNFSIRINGQLFKKILTEAYEFPLNIIKSGNYLKFERPCNYDLIIISNNKRYIHKKRQVKIFLPLQYKNEIEVYFKDLLLFKQVIFKDSILPNLYFRDGYFNLDTATKKNVKLKYNNKLIEFKPKDIKIKVELEKGLNKIEIQNVENAKISSSLFYYKNV